MSGRSGAGGGRPSSARGNPNQKLEDVQRKVDDVKGIMHKNISMTLERGEKLEVMEEKAEDLENQSKRFQQRATQVKRHFMCQYIKLTILIVFVLAVIATIIGVVIWQKTKSSGSKNNNANLPPVNIQAPPVPGSSPGEPDILSVTSTAIAGQLQVNIQNGAGMGSGFFAFYTLVVTEFDTNTQVTTPYYYSTPITVTGLISGKQYVVTARTWNNFGYGSFPSSPKGGTPL